MFLLQALQKWFASDEDMGDPVHVYLAELFGLLAPILQDREGSHWDFMFDIIDSNIETSSWNDASSLPGFYHSIRLASTLRELASRNGGLREQISNRLRSTIVTISRAVLSPLCVLLTVVSAECPAHVPSAREAQSHVADLTLHLGLELLQDTMPKEMINDDSMSALAELLRHQHSLIRQSGFSIARRVVEEIVKELVIEAELERESPPVIQLPATLLALLDGHAAQKSADESFLLGSLLVFEHFVHSVRLEGRQV